jgi:adenine deaminase
LFELEGRTHHDDMTRLLVDVALGREKADLVVQNASLVNVSSGEILESQDVAIKKDRIALVGNADRTIGASTENIDASNKFLVPGFIDGDVHEESAMISLSQFARAVVPHGTTTVVLDPHEIVNVLGPAGLQAFLIEARQAPLKVLVTFPSCVPSAPGFETSGAVISSADIEKAMQIPGVIGLGEMMDYPAVLSGNEGVHEKIAATLKAGRILEGHAVDLPNEPLAAYVAAGMTSCHECTTRKHVIDKVRLGMYVLIREGSIDLDLAETIRSVTEDGLEPRQIMLTANDRDPRTLLETGHMDHAVRRAIECGVDPIKAFQMATLNSAQHYECARQIGSISPGRYADIVILDDVRSVSVNTVIADGKIAARNHRLLVHLQKPNYPEFVKKSVHLKNPTEKDLTIRSKKVARGLVKIRAIGIGKTEAGTRSLELETSAENHIVQSDASQDIAKIAVFERHGRAGSIGLGFIQGLEIKHGAVAQTIAHDSHNLVVAGVSDTDMILATRTLIKSQGGMVVTNSSNVLAMVPLPIAGILSEDPIEEVSDQIENLKHAWKSIGSSLPYPHISLSITTLAVLPEMRITDKGLLDTVNFKFVDPVIQ